MDLNEALEAIELGDSESPSRSHRLDERERIFVAAFLTNGGRGADAARAAGYAKPDQAAYRLILRERIAEAIHKMTRRNLHAALPVAVGTLVELCRDEKAAWKDRRAAAEALLKLDRSTTATGPSVAVQVNVGRDDPVSEVIQGVWQNRARRMSGIAAPMPDDSDGLADAGDAYG
jgi:hypothetical protein